MNVPLETRPLRVRGICSSRLYRLYAPLDGNIQVRNVVQNEFDHLLVLLLADMANPRLRGERLTEFVCSQSILREAVVKLLQYCFQRSMNVSISDQ